MGDLFGILVFVVIGLIISSLTKDKKKGKSGGNGSSGTTEPNKSYRSSQTYRSTAVNARSVQSRTTSARSQTAKGVSAQKTSSRQQAPAKTSTIEMLNQKAANSGKTSIVQRAKQNTERLADDETLKEIEKEHGHSEKEPKEVVEHSRSCQTLKNAEEVELAVENQLGTTEDLIVKGYSGNLDFGRDILGESMDMLTAISQVPDMEIHPSADTSENSGK